MSLVVEDMKSSVVCLEEGVVYEVDRLVNIVNINLTNTNTMLDQLRTRLEKQLKLQEEVIRDQRLLMDQQNKAMQVLKSKLSTLEEGVVLPTHLSALNERMYDDNDQNSRKLNLRIDGIPLLGGDYVEDGNALLEYIQYEVKRLNVDISNDCFVKARRVEEKQSDGTKEHGSVVVEMSDPTSRIQFYMNRNNFRFHVEVDLTPGRLTTLTFAKQQLDSLVNPVAHQVVEFVYADLSGKLHLKSKSGQFYGFSSESEFIQLVRWLNEKQKNRHKNEVDMVLENQSCHYSKKQ